MRHSDRTPKEIDRAYRLLARKLREVKRLADRQEWPMYELATVQERMMREVYEWSYPKAK